MICGKKNEAAYAASFLHNMHVFVNITMLLAIFYTKAYVKRVRFLYIREKMHEMAEKVLQYNRGYDKIYTFFFEFYTIGGNYNEQREH